MPSRINGLTAKEILDQLRKSIAYIFFFSLVAAMCGVFVVGVFIFYALFPAN